MHREESRTVTREEGDPMLIASTEPLYPVMWEQSHPATCWQLSGCSAQTGTRTEIFFLMDGGAPSSLAFGLGLTPSAPRGFRPRLGHSTSFPGSSVCRWQSVIMKYRMIPKDQKLRVPPGYYGLPMPPNQELSHPTTC
ncbi:uncharacterized protein RBU33_005691 isoform 2-T2 [Hipposideros larvatus]